MRINIYSQELTKEVILVKKQSSDGTIHYGVRIYLSSPDVLHNTDEDDDRSAITFWIPHSNTFNQIDLAELLSHAASLAYNCPELAQYRP